MLNREKLTFLASERGAELLREASAQRGDLLATITRLRKRWSAEEASAALELLDLRARARDKFTRANEMFFTQQRLEQSSGERVAQWRAARFPEGAEIVDLCCGIGGDAVALACRGPAAAFDLDPAAAWCAKANATAYGRPLAVACADITRLRLRGHAAFWDPSRRTDGRRSRAGAGYQPPLEFYRELLERIPNLAVKVSPAIPDADLEAARQVGAHIEFVSDRGECKEAVLWFGDMGPTASGSVSILPEGVTLAADPGAPAPVVGPPGEWLLEPDPALVRAGLLTETCRETGAWLLDESLAYLTAASRPNSPLVDSYRVVEHGPFNLKAVRARLRQLGRQVTVVKRRGVPFEPEEMLRKLAGTGDQPSTLVLCAIAGRPTAILCEPLDRSV